MKQKFGGLGEVAVTKSRSQKDSTEKREPKLDKWGLPVATLDDILPPLDRLLFVVWRLWILGDHYSRTMHGRVIGTPIFDARWKLMQNELRNTAGVDSLQALKYLIRALMDKHREYYIRYGQLSFAADPMLAVPDSYTMESEDEF